MHILYVFYLYHTGKARLLFKTDLDRDRSGHTCNLKLKCVFFVTTNSILYAENIKTSGHGRY